MLQILLLVCSLSVAPADCDKTTALDFIYGPVVANELQCGLYGQGLLASLAIRPQEGEYLKVSCTKVK